MNIFPEHYLTFVYVVQGSLIKVGLVLMEKVLVMYFFSGKFLGPQNTRRDPKHHAASPEF